MTTKRPDMPFRGMPSRVSWLRDIRVPSRRRFRGDDAGQPITNSLAAEDAIAERRNLRVGLVHEYGDDATHIFRPAVRVEPVHGVDDDFSEHSAAKATRNGKE